MKTRLKVIVGVTSALIFTSVVIVFTFPQIAASRFSYFDANNGRLKRQWVTFGRIYRETVDETEYSMLLKNLGFAEQPAEWRMANIEELGIRSWFFPQHVSYTYGRIASDAYLFSQLVKFNEFKPEKTREDVTHFRELIQKGDASGVKNYVAILQRK